MQELTVIILFFAITIPAAVIFLIIATRQNIARSRRLLARPKPSPEQWCAQYCDPLGLDHEIAKKIAAATAKVLACSPTQILPSDSFAKQLALKPGRSKFFPASDRTIIEFESKGLRPLLGQAGLYRYQNEKQPDQTIADIIQWIQNYEFPNAAEIQRQLSAPSNFTAQKKPPVKGAIPFWQKSKFKIGVFALYLFEFISVSSLMLMGMGVAAFPRFNGGDQFNLALAISLGGPLIFWAHWHGPFLAIRKWHQRELPLPKRVGQLIILSSALPSIVLMATAALVLTITLEPGSKISPWTTLLIFIPASLITVANFFVTKKLLRYSKLDPLDLKNCPTCKYNLQNLPQIGCPECGWYRQQSKNKN